MIAVINQSVVSLSYKASEADRVQKIIDIMSEEVSSLCQMEFYKTEATLCYSSDEITVADIKKSYSDAKKATKNKY